MVLAGSGGHARELYDLLSKQEQQEVVAFEEMTTAGSVKWKGYARVITSKEMLFSSLISDRTFALATGNPDLRERFYNELIVAGFTPVSIMASTIQISSVNVITGKALNIMHFVFISNNVTIGTGVLLNTGCRIHHDCVIGDFTEISPNVTITGNCIIGNKCSIGASATVLPGVTIGDHSIIGAGAVVTKNVEPGTLVTGIPAKVVRNL